MLVRHSLALVAIVLGLTNSLFVSAASASTFGTPAWSRPATEGAALSTLTTYQAWNENFTSPSAPNVPSAYVNPGKADLVPSNIYALDTTAATDGAFMTGPHIYSYLFPTNVATYFPSYHKGAGWNTEVYVQVEVVRSLSQSDVLLSYLNDALNTVTIGATNVTLVSAPYNAGPQATFKNFYTFSFATAGFDPAAFRVIFPGAEPSLSFWGVSIDTRTSLPAVPEPTSLVLAGLGGLGLLLGTRRLRG